MTRGSQPKTRRRRLHAPARIGFLAGLERLHALQPALGGGAKIAVAGHGAQAQLRERDLFQRQSGFAEQGDAQRQGGFLVEPEAKAVTPLVFRLQLDDLRLASRDACRAAELGLVGLQAGGVGEFFGRIPLPGGIAVVAHRLRLRADHHHDAVVAHDLAARATERQHAHALAPVLVGVENRDGLDAIAGHDDQRSLVVLFAQRRPDAFEPVARRFRPQTAHPGLRAGDPALRGGRIGGQHRRRERRQQREGQRAQPHRCASFAGSAAAASVVSLVSLATTST